MNPEFLRNLWLELSPQRLLFMPALLGIIFGLIVANGRDASYPVLSYWSVVLFFILAGIWGPRRARDAFIEEGRQGTWDTQRMSALRPWDLTWGKLFGSTIYVWYAAGICLAVFLLSDTGGGWPTSVDGSGDNRALNLGEKLRFALLFFSQCLFIQSLAAAAGLLSLRTPERAGLIGIALLVFVWFGFFQQLSLLSRVVREAEISINWWGIACNGQDFVLLSTVMFCAWSVIGLWRLVAQELRVYTLPYAWFGFCLYLIVWMLGLFDASERSWVHMPGMSAIILLALAYFAVFLEPRDPLLLQRLVRLGRAGEYQILLKRLPSSLPTLLLAIVFSLLTLVLSQLGLQSSTILMTLDRESIPLQLPLIVGILGIRDFALLQFYVLGSRPDRALVNFTVALFCLDVLAPWLLSLLGGFENQVLGSLIFPYAGALFVPLAGLSTAVIHAAIPCILLYWRWQYRFGVASTPTPHDSARRPRSL